MESGQTVSANDFLLSSIWSSLSRPKSSSSSYSSSSSSSSSSSLSSSPSSLTLSSSWLTFALEALPALSAGSLSAPRSSNRSTSSDSIARPPSCLPSRTISAPASSSPWEREVLMCSCCDSMSLAGLHIAPQLPWRPEKESPSGRGAAIGRSCSSRRRLAMSSTPIGRDVTRSRRAADEVTPIEISFR